MPGATGAGTLATAWGATLPGGLMGRHDGGRIIPSPSATGAVPPGRTLEAYRAAPITWAYRAPAVPPPTPIAKPAALPRQSVHFLR